MSTGDSDGASDSAEVASPTRPVARSKPAPRPRRKRNANWAYVVAAVVILALAGLLVYTAIGPKKSTTTYVSQAATTGTLTVAVAGNGSVVSADSASVNPQVSGTVTLLNVSLGGYVKKGDQLFVLDNPTLDQSVVQARASYQQAQSSTAKALQAKTQAAVGKQTSVLQAKAQLQQAQVQVTNAQIALSKATTSPPDPAMKSAQQNLAAANTNLKTAEENYEAACTLARQNYSAAVKTYNAAVTSQEAAFLSYQQAITNADMRTVLAPITGYITTLSINNGDQISGNGSSASVSRASTSGGTGTTSASSASANSPIVITNLSTLQATVQIAETDRPKVKQGQKVELTFDAVPNLTITGKVAEIDAVGTSSSGVVTYNVSVTFDVQDKRLTPGMTASASIVTAVYTDVLLVPNAAIKTDSSGQTYVQVQSAPGATPQNVNVTVGAAGDSDTVVTSGLKAGDLVVVQTVTPNSATSTTGGTRTGFSVLGGGGGGGRAFGGGGGRPGQ